MTWRAWLKRWHPEGIPWLGTVFYDAISRSGVFEEHYRLVAADIGERCPGGRVLDVGTGPGRLLLALGRGRPDLHLVGADISSAMVSAARRNLARAGVAEQVTVVEAPAGALPFDDASFDAVVSTASLHHWKDPARALDEIHRVLEPGGLALLYDLVTELPPEVRRRVRERFGRFRATVLWLHSFEEPFLSPQDMTALVVGTRFSRAETSFVGALCCLELQKN